MHVELGQDVVEHEDRGFEGSDDKKVAQALDSTEGFNLVQAACKAWLEHGIDLRLVADKAPDAHVGRPPG
jgi:hypothetical protein